MSVIGKLLILGAGLVLVTAIGFGVLWNFVIQPSAIPQLAPQWWGPGGARKDDPTIKPFKITFSNEVIEDLVDRLELLPPITSPLENGGFHYGFNSDYLQEVANFWLKKYDFMDREEFLNSLPQFKTQISGLQLHFIHVKPTKVPEGMKIVPLLLLHGWPGSVREFYSLIPLLTTPNKDADFVFEVIAPSLPGFGFSEGAAKPGLGAAQISVVMKLLMERLGFKEFYVQGGDAGAVIGAIMGSLYPISVKGLHSNMCSVNSPTSMFKQVLGSIWPSLFLDEASASRMSLTEYFMFLLEEYGYAHIQATKPDTVGIALRDSPVGLAAYILEKFSTWTNPDWRSRPDGGLTEKYTLTDLLDNVMIYWVSGSITTSMRLYSETLNIAHSALQLDSVPVTVPSACAMFPREIMYYPESLLKERYTNLVRFTVMPRGGHFAAFEEPQLLADDIWAAISTMRNVTSS